MIIYSLDVQFSCSVVSDSLWTHGLQYTRPPCPSPTPRVYSNSCPLSRWCHPTVSSSVIPFSSHLQSFPASGSFQMSQFFASGGPILKQSIVPCLILTTASWPAYRFLRRQVRWSGIPISWRIFYKLYPHSPKLKCSPWSRNSWFSGTLLLFLWSNGCWQFKLWFLCLFQIQLEHLEVHGSHTIEG